MHAFGVHIPLFMQSDKHLGYLLYSEHCASMVKLGVSTLVCQGIYTPGCDKGVRIFHHLKDKSFSQAVTLHISFTVIQATISLPSVSLYLHVLNTLYGY